MAYPKLFQFILKHIKETMVINVVVSNIIEIGDDVEIPKSVEKDIARKGGLDKIIGSLPSEYELSARSLIHRALSDPARLNILHLLSEQPMCVCLIKQVTSIPDSNLSYHLQKLKEAGLIEGVQEKNWIIYRATEIGCKQIDRCK